MANASSGTPYQLEKDLTKKVFWAGNIDHLPDPVRSTRWRLCVDAGIFKAIGINPTNGEPFGTTIESARDFTLHIKGGAKVPDADIRHEAIHYMGYEKKYPVQQQNLAGQMDLQALLLEDGRAYETMLAWNQCCLNSGILNSSGTGDTNSDTNRIEQGSNQLYLGLGQQENYGNSTAVLLRNTHVTLELYDWMHGFVIMGIRLINAWPSTVKVSTQFDYAQAKLADFSFTLQYDRWNIWFNGNYQVIGKKEIK